LSICEAVGAVNMTGKVRQGYAGIIGGDRLAMLGAKEEGATQWRVAPSNYS